MIDLEVATILMISVFSGVFLIVFGGLLCCCYHRRKDHSQSEIFPKTPVVVTSATHTAPGGYPVSQMPMSSSTTAYQTHVYAAPYPPQGAPTHMPMPMPMPGGQPPAPGIQPYAAPYPPMPSAANMNPPSYDMAVGGPGTGQQNSSGFEKQAPYNPSYQM